MPVCENDGQVCGVVDVMDLIYGCGGMDEWRSKFESAMDIGGDYSDTESIQSAGLRLLRSVRSLRSILKSMINRHQFYWKCSIHSRRRCFCSWVYYIYIMESAPLLSGNHRETNIKISDFSFIENKGMTFVPVIVGL